MYKEDMKFQNTGLYETDKIAISVHIISTNFWWRRIFHE